jgi:hypothetical protein
MLSLFSLLLVLEICVGVLIFKYSKDVEQRHSWYSFQAIASNVVIVLLMIGHLVFDVVVFIGITAWSSYSLYYGYNHKKTLAFTSIALGIQIYTMVATVFVAYLFNN